MKVNFFVVSTKPPNPIKIEKLHKLLDPKSPIPLQYEGGTGLNYLCCVSSNIDVKSICESNGYICHTPYSMEIDDELYSNKYEPHPTYNKDDPKYQLEIRQRFEQK